MMAGEYLTIETLDYRKSTGRIIAEVIIALFTGFEDLGVWII